MEIHIQYSPACQYRSHNMVYRSVDIVYESADCGHVKFPFHFLTSAFITTHSYINLGQVTLQVMKTMISPFSYNG